jgi:hypothetical protein
VNSLVGSAAMAPIEHVFVNVARSTDGLNRNFLHPGLYCPPTRLWRNW